MAATDSPLKQLVEACIMDFATWLLDSAVIDAQPLNMELLAQTVRVDQLYRVTLANNRVSNCILNFRGCGRMSRCLCVCSIIWHT
ncbi:hypothetical protein BH10CHL1_BH10CHL1_29930 [soil metagenome]